MKRIKINDEYHIKVSELETDSNYNKGVHLFRKGEKSPIASTTMRDNLTDMGFVNWGIATILRIKNENFTLN